jgi:hypothetical protein
MKQAVVTGASKGLGKAFAHKLAELGFDLLLVARSEKILAAEAQSLNGTYKVSVKFLPLDLSDSQVPYTILNWCNEHQFRPSVLINNAGFACWGFFEKLELIPQQQVMAVNINTMVNLTHLMLPLLKQQPRSFILNVASTAAFQSVPTMAIYAASKSFVRSFTRTLRYELKGSTVSVTCLSPGPIASNFIKQAGMEAMQETATKFEMTSEAVAAKALRDMFNGKSESVPGWLNYLNVRLSFIVPDFILEKVAANLYMSKLK